MGKLFSKNKISERRIKDILKATDWQILDDCEPMTKTWIIIDESKHKNKPSLYICEVTFDNYVVKRFHIFGIWKTPKKRILIINELDTLEKDDLITINF